MIGKRFGLAIGLNRRNAIVDNGNLFWIGIVVIGADFLSVMTDRNNVISFLQHLLLEIVNLSLLVRPCSVVIERMNVKYEGFS